MDRMIAMRLDRWRAGVGGMTASSRATTTVLAVPDIDATREDRLRRQAKRLGSDLTKSRVGGIWRIIDTSRNELMSEAAMSIDEVDEWVTAMAERDYLPTRPQPGRRHL